MGSLEQIQESYTRTTLIPVIGSGLSVPFGLPDWKTLIVKSAEHFNLPQDKINTINDLLDEFKFVEATDVIINTGVGEQELQQFVAGHMLAAKQQRHSNPENNYDDLALMDKIRYMTTNYDGYVNDITRAKTFLLDNFEKIPVNEFPNSTYDHVVIPLHGEITRPESIVFSGNSYKALYDKEKFNGEFQLLRTHFTFLFMGFSFEDGYVQKLFDKVVQRFDAHHFILFNRSEKDRNPDKIKRLWDKYGIEAVYYDASNGGHTKAISRWLEDIFKLRDSSVDYTTLKKLSAQDELVTTAKEKAILDTGWQYIRHEQLQKLYDTFWQEYKSTAFVKHSVSFKVQIVCGLLWYYGFLRQDVESQALVEDALKDCDIDKNQERLTFMRGQLYWNIREYDKGIELLESYSKDKILIKLLLDIIKAHKLFLPQSSGEAANIPVYGEVERSLEDKKSYAVEYRKLKQKYINPDTFNLLNLNDYEDRETESIAYYWLGVTAGQLFHEHAEAIQYLLRSYELNPLMVVNEELAHNYFALATVDTRYVKEPKKYQLNVDVLYKARIRFQYVMNFSDKAAVDSMVKRSGFAYLQTLCWLGEFVAFYDFYNKHKTLLPDEPGIWTLRAEVDAAYEHTVSPEVMDKLSATDRLYAGYNCVVHRAELFGHINPYEARRLYNEIIEHSKHDYPIQDRRVVQIVTDAIFFTHNVAYYEVLKGQYPQEWFEIFQQLDLEDELYGRIDVAKQRFENAFAQHKDYGGTFRVLKSFYIRHGMRAEFDKLYAEVISNPPNEQYKQPGFYAGHVISVNNDWHDQWGALKLYADYYDFIKDDMMQQKELEEVLKSSAADYSNYEDRISWNRHMMTKVPRYARIELYESILRLYVANSKYREAAAVLEEMKELKVPVVGGFDKLIMVCLREQDISFYKGNAFKTFLDNAYRLNKSLNYVNGKEYYHLASFGAAGQDVIMPTPYLLSIFNQNRQEELAAIGKIHIMYACIIGLQYNLWTSEYPIIRRILQWIEVADNVVLEAPDFLDFCIEVQKEPNKNMAEAIQLKLFRQEHKDYVMLEI